jgi:hypothetical protein
VSDPINRHKMTPVRRWGCSEVSLAYANQLILPVCPPLAVLVACALRVLRAHVLPWGRVRWIWG